MLDVHITLVCLAGKSSFITDNRRSYFCFLEIVYTTSVWFRFVCSNQKALSKDSKKIGTIDW